MKLFLALMAVLLLQTCIVSATVYLNTTAPCVASGLCDFTNSSTWVGNYVPESSDAVAINFNGSPLVVLISNTTVTVNSITLSGSVTLNVQYATLQSNAITWSGVAVVEATSSTVDVSLRATGSTLILSDSTFDCTTLGTLTLAQANITESVVTARTVNISAVTITGVSSEIYATSSTLIDSLYSYGSVQYSSLTISTYALFESAYLRFTYLLISGSGATVLFHNSQINIQTVTVSAQANIMLNQSTQSNFINNLVCSSVFNRACQVYLNNVSLTLGGVSNAHVIADNTVHLSLIGSAATLYEIISNPNSQVYINCSTTLTFLYSDISIQANLYLLRNGVLNIQPSYYLTFIPTTTGLCPISGKGGKIFLGTASMLTCDGALNVGIVEIQSSILNVTEVTVAYLLHVTSLAFELFTPTSAINGDLAVEGSLQIDSDSKLVISGDYEHDPINAILADFSVSFERMPEENSPVIKVGGEAHISSENALITVDDGFEGELFLLEAKEIKKASFKSITDGHDSHHTLGPKVREEEKLYILTPEESDFEWISQNWIFFLIVCVVTFGFALLFARLMYKALSARRVGNIGTSLPAYLSSLKVSKLTCCGKFELILFFIFYAPFFLEAAALTLALALLIPLGFVFGLIEHKFVFVWAVLVFFIQIGGLLDLFADLVLLAKTSLWYIEAQIDSTSKSDIDYLEGTDLMLWVIRVGLTFVSALVAIFLMFSLFTTLGRKLDTMSGKQYFADKKISTPGMAGSAFFVVILLVVFWKILLIAMRVYLLFIVLKSLIQKGKLEESVQRRVQWVESVLYLDLMWSGLPLGILTMFELFYFSEDFELGKEQIFELMKLSALAVDLMGAAFLFWFIVVGLIKKIPLLHHHDHHAHDSHAHSQIAIPNEKQPLIQHDAKH